MTVEQAKPAADFIDSIGVGTHLNYYDTPYGDFARVRSAIDYLGIHHVRESIGSQTEHQRRIDALGADGVKFNFVMQGNSEYALQKQLIAQRAGITASIEGPNETDIFPFSFGGSTGPAGAAKMMQDINAWVDSSAALRGKPVIQASYADSANVSKFGNLSAYADYANTHTYFGRGDAPSGAIEFRMAEAQKISPGLPTITTETGYYTAPGVTWGINEAVDGKYEPRNLLEAYAHGIERTYLYELLDEGTGGREKEGSFGLFRADGTPKPAATAIHNMTTILSDAAGSNFTPGKLDYTLTGMPGTADDLLLQESGDTFNLVLWNDADNWNENNQTAISVPDAPVRLSLGQTFQSVKVYDISAGTTPVKTFSNVSSLDLGVPDHAVIVELSGAGTAPPAPTPTPTPTPPPPPPPAPPSGGGTVTVGAGPDTLLLRISQDAWNGNAQYTISVDGRQIGGTLTASALHAQGMSDTVTVKGDWGAGSHNVSLRLTNDAWGGTPTTDRNLYLDGVFYNNQVVPNASKALLDGVPQSFGFTEHSYRTRDGGSGNDTLTGSFAAESMNGQGGNDVLYGRAGNDRLNGGSGADRLFGGDGNDILTGDIGNDALDGGSGADTFVFRAGQGADSVASFARGTDKLVFAGVGSAATDFASATIGGVSGTNVTFDAGGSVFLPGVASLTANDYVFA